MSTIRTIKRRPIVGDIVRAVASGALYRVESVHYEHVLSTRVAFYGVVDFAEERYPNAFRPEEVQTVAAADVRRLYAERDADA